MESYKIHPVSGFFSLIMFLKYIHVEECINSSFFFIVEYFLCVDVPHNECISVGLFPIQGCMSKAATNIQV